MGIYSGNSGMDETSLSPLGFVLSNRTYHCCEWMVFGKKCRDPIYRSRPLYSSMHYTDPLTMTQQFMKNIRHLFMRCLCQVQKVSFITASWFRRRRWEILLRCYMLRMCNYTCRLVSSQSWSEARQGHICLIRIVSAQMSTNTMCLDFLSFSKHYMFKFWDEPMKIRQRRDWCTLDLDKAKLH